eukprot:9218174-Pyramimonas_sp.AAC.1
MTPCSLRGVTSAVHTADPRQCSGASVPPSTVTPAAVKGAASASDHSKVMLKGRLMTRCGTAAWRVIPGRTVSTVHWRLAAKGRAEPPGTVDLSLRPCVRVEPSLAESPRQCANQGPMACREREYTWSRGQWREGRGNIPGPWTNGA